MEQCVFPVPHPTRALFVHLMEAMVRRELHVVAKHGDALLLLIDRGSRACPRRACRYRCCDRDHRGSRGDGSRLRLDWASTGHVFSVADDCSLRVWHGSGEQSSRLHSAPLRHRLWPLHLRRLPVLDRQYVQCQDCR